MLHNGVQVSTLNSALHEVWRRIQEEAENDAVSPFLPDENSRMRQSVVISWSDESSWHKDSRERITKEMFPFKDYLPDNVTLQ